MSLLDIFASVRPGSIFTTGAKMPETSLAAEVAGTNGIDSVMDALPSTLRVMAIMRPPRMGMLDHRSRMSPSAFDNCAE